MKTILIADDNERIRSLVSSFFYKFRVYEAADGAEAVGKISETQPDLIVLDFMMPKMNGLEAARKLRQMKVGVPIILFTMYLDDISRIVLSRHGISAVVPKPNLLELHNRIESFF